LLGGVGGRRGGGQAEADEGNDDSPDREELFAHKLFQG
jgi:hypothetical protein